MNALNHLLIAIAGTVGLALAWLAVQNLKRRSDPALGAGRDVLACHTCAAHSCVGCALHEPRHHGGLS